MPAKWSGRVRRRRRGWLGGSRSRFFYRRYGRGCGSRRFLLADGHVRRCSDQLNFNRKAALLLNLDDRARTIIRLDNALGKLPVRSAGGKAELRHWATILRPGGKANVQIPARGCGRIARVTLTGNCNPSRREPLFREINAACGGSQPAPSRRQGLKQTQVQARQSRRDSSQERWHLPGTWQSSHCRI